MQLEAEGHVITEVTDRVQPLKILEHTTVDADSFIRSPGVTARTGTANVRFVRDNGAGVDLGFARKRFGTFSAFTARKVTEE